MKSIFEVFIKGYKKNRDANYLGSHTYLDIAKRIIALSDYFSYENFCQQKRVGILCEDPELFTIIFWSLQKLGITTVLFNPKTIGNNLEYCTELSTVKNIVSDKEYDLLGTDKDLEIYTIDDDFMCRKLSFVQDGTIEQELCNVRINLESIIQCSSGTTGIPKMVLRELPKLENDINNIVDTLDYASEDRIYCTAPVCHGFGLTMAVLAGTYVGGTLLLRKCLLASSFSKEYKYWKPTIILGIPDAFRMILRGSTLSVFNNETRLLISSGDKADRDLLKQFHDRFGRWINQMYGMLEASTISVNLEPDSKNFDSVGKSVNNVRIEIRDINKETSIGKIYISSNALSNDYLSGDRFLVDGWYFTKDLGHQDAKGNLYIDERWKKE